MWIYLKSGKKIIFLQISIVPSFKEASNSTSTVVRNLTVFSSTTDKIKRVSNHFLERWRHGYVVNLCKTQRTSKLNINSLKINANYEKVSRYFWRIAIVTPVLSSRVSEIRGVIARIAKTNTKLFAVENTYYDTNQAGKAMEQ